MSGKDKTRQKLMASMRKTKAGSTTKTEKEQPKIKSQPKVKSQPKKAVKNKSITQTRAKPSRSTTDKVTVDAYQTGRRVWPD